MKILKHIVSTTVWGMMALYLTALITVRIPSVQELLGSKVAMAIGKQIGTKVKIGRVDLGMLNRLIIDDVLILDQKQKEMVKVARLTARIDLLPLTQGKISIASAQIFGAHLSLYKETAESSANFQFVIDSLTSNDTTSKPSLDLRVNSFIMRNSSITFDQWDIPPTNGIMNPAHLSFSDISAHIILKVLKEDSVNINIKRMAFEEQSGLAVDRISMKLNAGNHRAELTDFCLAMKHTELRASQLTATYDKSRIKETLKFKGGFTPSSLSLADFKSLAPPLKNFQVPLLLSLSCHGNGQNVSVDQLTLKSEKGDLSLAASGSISPFAQLPAWKADIKQLSIGNTFTEYIDKNVSPLPSPLLRAGNISIRGTVRRENDGVTSAYASANTDAGDLGINGSLTASKLFEGEIETESLDLGKLIEDEKFGRLTAHVSMSGHLADEHAKSMIKVKGGVPQLDYNGYSYSNILVDGGYSAEDIEGSIRISDPNLNAEIEGLLAKPKIRLNGRINRIAPTLLGLTDKWGSAVFSGDIEADFTASNLSDAIGALSLRNFKMSSEESGNYQLNYLRIESGFDEEQHYVILNSDFAHAELTGEFDYTTLSQSFTNFIGSKLPTLPGLPPISNKVQNNFALRLTMDRTDWMQKLLGIRASLEQPLTLIATVNDQTRQISMDGQLPAFSYNGSQYSNGRIQITTPMDTMLVSAELTKKMDDGQAFDMQLTAKAADNDLTTSLSWQGSNDDLPMSGRLNAVGHLYRNFDDEQEAHLRILPSELTLNGSQWLVEPSDILYSSNRLLVDHFAINNGDQFIRIDGIASKSPSDSLFIDLNDVEVAYILNLVNFHAVEFSGKATGRAYVASAFDTPAASARLKVHQFLFEHGRMGTLSAEVDWNQQKKQIDIMAVANDGPEATTFIDGYVSPEKDFIDLGITAQGTYLDFMHSFTESFISNITGHANGTLRLAGPLSAINLTGGLVVDGEATITPLGTTYELRKDTIEFTYNEISLNRIAVYDRYNNVGYLSGGIHHKDLTKLTFDLQVETDNLLAYDFIDFGEQTFYGTVFAAGDVSIQGRPGRITINCNVTPQKNTIFTYNAANPDAISTQEFITWNSHSGQLLNTSQKEETDKDPPTDIYLNFLINTNSDATMRLLMDQHTGDYITLNGNGTIRATYYNKGAFNMFGTYTVEHGTYDITIQNIIKKNFLFQEGGTIVFGGDPYNAALSLQALHTVSGVSLSDLNIGNSFTSNTIRVNCLMNIGGQPNAPQVTFDLDMPTVNTDEKQMVRSLLASQQEMNQQVLYLLGIGRFYNNQGNNNAQANQQDQTSLAMQSFLSGTLSTQLNTVLNQVIKNDDWNFGANISTGTEGWNNAEYEGIVNGRMLNNRLLINGQFGYRDKATQANPSFIGDFDIRYLLFPNGNLALKVYNQTNDRYFTRSSLNTQGIGLIMKKDFNGISELFTRKKKASVK